MSDIVGGNFRDADTAHQAHVTLDLGAKNRQHARHACFTARRQTVKARPTDRASVGAKRDRLKRTSVPRRTPPSAINWALIWIRSRITRR
nr:hypothetical protein [Sphingopyxis sp.]